MENLSYSKISRKTILISLMFVLLSISCNAVGSSNQIDTINEAEQVEMEAVQQDSNIEQSVVEQQEMEIDCDQINAEIKSHGYGSLDLGSYFNVAYFCGMGSHRRITSIHPSGIAVAAFDYQTPLLLDFNSETVIDLTEKNWSEIYLLETSLSPDATKIAGLTRPGETDYSTDYGFVYFYDLTTDKTTSYKTDFNFREEDVMCVSASKQLVWIDDTQVILAINSSHFQIFDINSGLVKDYDLNLPPDKFFGNIPDDGNCKYTVKLSPTGAQYVLFGKYWGDTNTTDWVFLIDSQSGNVINYIEGKKVAWAEDGSLFAASNPGLKILNFNGEIISEWSNTAAVGNWTIDQTKMLSNLVAYIDVQTGAKVDAIQYDSYYKLGYVLWLPDSSHLFYYIFKSMDALGDADIVGVYVYDTELGESKEVEYNTLRELILSN